MKWSVMLSPGDNPVLQCENEAYYESIRPRLLEEYNGAWVLCQDQQCLKFAKNKSGVLKYMLGLEHDKIPGVLMRHIGLEEQEQRPRKT